MKCCVIQPLYGRDFSENDGLFRKELELLDTCDSTMDLIVLPEAADVLALPGGKENLERSVFLNSQVLIDKCMQTAIRCNAIVFVNSYTKADSGCLLNTTRCFDRHGQEVGRYYKQHLTPGESRNLENTYSYEYSEPYILELEGLRYAFLTCYDFYFYEMFSNIAKQNVDVIIGCSHQRSDTLDALEIINRFLCYNTNAYLIRSSVTLGESSETGGGSMIVSPRGEILAGMGMKVGLVCAEINPHEKYLKPAGFGNPDKPHHEYIEAGRRPMKYRPAGPAICADDMHMTYPRLCAHRGCGKPENTLPSLSAAVSLGADEIEFDIRVTRDGKLVSIHDARLDRTSNGVGRVSEYTYDELLELDFGGSSYPGLKICTFEEILKKLACHCIMNIHLKPLDENCIYDWSTFVHKVWDLVVQYDCEKHVYFMTGEDERASWIMEEIPNARVCLGGGKDYWGIVDRAIRLGCYKVQMVNGYFTRQMIDKAHEHGILCNVWASNNVQEAREFVKMGIDTILTDEFVLLKYNL